MSQCSLHLTSVPKNYLNKTAFILHLCLSEGSLLSFTAPPTHHLPIPPSSHPSPLPLYFHSSSAYFTTPYPYPLLPSSMPSLLQLPPLPTLPLPTHNPSPAYALSTPALSLFTPFPTLPHCHSYPLPNPTPFPTYNCSLPRHHPMPYLSRSFWSL